jgi:hypothetical protein
MVVTNITGNMAVSIVDAMTFNQDLRGKQLIDGFYTPYFRTADGFYTPFLQILADFQETATRGNQDIALTIQVSESVHPAPQPDL